MIKRLWTILMVTGLLAGTAFLVACSAAQDSPAAPATESSATSVQPDTKSFTLEELAKYNGQNGNPAYIAIEGTVYDVTNIPQWKEGLHAGRFEAGKDYTKELKNQAPHDAGKMKEAPVVGVLTN